jgi:hypothetical protein
MSIFLSVDLHQYKTLALGYASHFGGRERGVRGEISRREKRRARGQRERRDRKVLKQKQKRGRRGQHVASSKHKEFSHLDLFLPFNVNVGLVTA